jgi:hypothetical protein
VIAGCVGWVRLEDHAAFARAAARAPGDLREELEGPLRGAEVRERERLIREEHAHERHARQVVALRDHLRAHEHVDLSASHTLEHLLDARARSDVSVEARDACTREHALEARLELLGAEGRAARARAHRTRRSWHRAASRSRSSDIARAPRAGAR